MYLSLFIKYLQTTFFKASEPLQSDVVSVQNDAVSVQNDVVSVQGDVVSVQSDVVLVQNDVVSVESDVVSVQNEPVAKLFHCKVKPLQSGVVLSLLQLFPICIL